MYRQSFVKYLTPSWAKAASYTWSQSNTTTWTVSGGATYEAAETVRLTLGLSRSRTTTYSIGITIPEDSSRFSKLGFASI